MKIPKEMQGKGKNNLHKCQAERRKYMSLGIFWVPRSAQPNGQHLSFERVPVAHRVIASHMRCEGGTSPN